MKKPKIKPGDLVIANEFDRPCSRLIAVVYAIKGKSFNAMYISNDLAGNQCSGQIDACTLVSDFGVKVVFNEDGSSYHVEKIGRSKAMYRSGKPREWQESV